MLTDEDYKRSRKAIDEIISVASSLLGNENHLQNLAIYRASCVHKYIKEWYEYYSKKQIIRKFTEHINIPSNLHKILASLYTDYFRHTFIYRILNGNTRNIIFTKIISFELHFFKKNGIIGIRENESKDVESPNGHEILFHMDPLAHFTYFRILKEIHLNNSLDVQNSQKLADVLLSFLLHKLTDFFSNHKDIGLYDFFNFTEKAEQIQLKQILSGIDGN